MKTKIILNNKKIFTKDLISKQKREWDPFRSKVAAGIKKGIIPEILENYKVLYLGAAEGYTISYISDILEKGYVYGIDISPYSMQKLLILSNTNKNIIPILGDCNKIEDYQNLISEKVDFIIQDVAQKNQVEILIKNSNNFLKEKGKVLLSLKLSAISQKNNKKNTDNQLNLFKSKFNILNQKRLDPFEKKHILILGQKK